MNAATVAVRSGIQRGVAESRQVFTSMADLWNMLFFPVVGLIVMFFLRDTEVPSTGVSIGTAGMSGMIGMQVAFAGFVGVSAALMVEREDGTLLRLKAIPNGVVGYLTGKIVVGLFGGFLSLFIVLVPGVFLFEGLDLGVGSWLTLLWVTSLGLLATMPIGAAIGSLSDNPRNLGLVMLPLMAMAAISGIFYPITALPDWLETAGQLFPMYWLGLGMRSALLPDGAAVAEIGESWRYTEMVGVLGLWAAVGCALAPMLLRRMARRESGAAMSARKERAQQRVQ